MSELKACPFCGKEPEIIRHFIKGVANKTNVFIACKSCMVRTRDRKNENGAIDEWNTRPIEGALQAELTALRTSLKEAVKEIKEYGDEQYDGYDPRNPASNKDGQYYVYQTIKILRENGLVELEE